VDFLDISNPRAVLEYTLRKYTCVTEGDVLVLQHMGKLFHMDVLEGELTIMRLLSRTPTRVTSTNAN
jgi:hypothetical protein